jgi:hypothetical protein
MSDNAKISDVVHSINKERSFLSKKSVHKAVQTAI